MSRVAFPVRFPTFYPSIALSELFARAAVGKSLCIELTVRVDASTSTVDREELTGSDCWGSNVILMGLNGEALSLLLELQKNGF